MHLSRYAHSGEALGAAHYFSHYEVAKRIVATAGSAVGMALIFNAVRKTPGFDMRKNTLSETRHKGNSFSLGAVSCGISTILLARLLREHDLDCTLNKISSTGFEAAGYSICAAGLTKWVLKGKHAHFAGFYFVGTPLFLALSSIDEFRHKSKVAGTVTLAAAGAAMLSFIVGYDKEKVTIPATFETAHAVSLSTWALGLGTARFLIPLLRDSKKQE